MGDLRNKMKRILDSERMARQFKEQRARDAAKPRGPFCRCGLTYLQVPIMWQIAVEDWPIKYGLFCPGCLPAKYLPLVAIEAANLPDDLPD
jgi:hypothetical protein